MATFVLVHSPWVGPSTWDWLAPELERLGHEVVVADLTRGVAAGEPMMCVELAAATASSIRPSGRIVLVGHSGAGLLLPATADRAGIETTDLIFLDAVLPPASGRVATIPEALGQLLRPRADADGLLPRWSTWFGDDQMETLIPDGERRAGVCRGIPAVPASYLDEEVSLPDDWPAGRSGAYLLLSDPYRDDARRAEELGWPVARSLGAHLDIVNRPQDLAKTLDLLGSRLSGG